MADVGYRPRQDGGRRGGGGGFNNRKRRYRDDDEDQDRGGRSQRRRYEDPPAVQMRKQVIAIAEAPHRRVEEDITSIAKTISDNYFDTDLTNNFLDLVVSLSVEQPLKIPFLAAILLQTNVQKSEFTTEVLKKVAESLQENINQGHWREVKLLLRFLACVQGLFEGEGIFPFLNDVFDRAAELQTESSDDTLGLELTKIVLFTIAYTMASSATGYEAQAESLLDKTDVIASTPHLLENLVDPFPSAEAGAPSSHESALSLLQKHMQEESKNQWRLSCLPRPWKAMKTENEEDVLASAAKHPFPTLELPTPLPIGPRQIFPEVYFSVYAQQDLDSVPPAADPSALLIRDVLSDAIDVMHFNRAIAGKALIDMDCYFADGTFIKRATTFDKLPEVAGPDRPAWKPEDVIVDATFSRLFVLPTPEHKHVYYHSVLTESCKIAPAAVAPSLGRAIRYLYRNVDRMDLELTQRFLDWFAHHLSNFGFTWKWSEWIDDVELPNTNPKKAFILDALDKEIRLSFAARIKGVLPEPYQKLITPAKELDTPEFIYSNSTNPFHTVVNTLITAIRSRNDDDLSQALDSITSLATTESGMSVEAAQLECLKIYTTTLLHIGSKSLSHALAIIERHLTRLTTLSQTSQEHMKAIFTAISTYYAHQPGTAVFLVDKLLNYGILTPPTVIDRLLVDNIDSGRILVRNSTYELVCTVISKVVSRARKLVVKIYDPSSSLDERTTMQNALAAETENMKVLFTQIEAAVSSVANGTERGMLENVEQDGKGMIDDIEKKDIMACAARWVRFIRRRSAVEEGWVRDETAKPLPEPKVTVPAEANADDENMKEAEVEAQAEAYTEV